MTDLIMAESAPKRPRTSEDFYLFCKFILEYENYEENEREEPQNIEKKSVEEKTDENSKSSVEDSQHPVGLISEEEDSYDVVTCFCRKPFAGRPMIECSKCLTWIHLRCAKVKKSEIPEVFICAVCQDKEDLN